MDALSKIVSMAESSILREADEETTPASRDESDRRITMPEEHAASADDVEHEEPESATGQQQLSKKQLKKLKRRQEWEDGRQKRKDVRKEKRTKLKERKREAVRNGDLPADSLRKAREPRIVSELVPITILIDCSFEEQMTREELISMGSQLTRCYADHRKARFRTHLAVSSFDGALKDRFEGILNNQHKSWDVRFRQGHFADVAVEAREWMRDQKRGPVLGEMPNDDAIETEEYQDPEAESAEQGEVIYLTSDSPNTLEALNPYSTYIIGGIVDKNRHKGICYQRACEHKVKTVRLPIGDFIKLSSRHVLTTNHVHEIMLKWLEYRDWGKAFMAVIPQRKGGTLKTQQTAEQSPLGNMVVADEASPDGSEEVAAETKDAESYHIEED